MTARIKSSTACNARARLRNIDTVLRAPLGWCDRPVRNRGLTIVGADGDAARAGRVWHSGPASPKVEEKAGEESRKAEHRGVTRASDTRIGYPFQSRPKEEESGQKAKQRKTTTPPVSFASNFDEPENRLKRRSLPLLVFF